jgi:serine protease AprX
MFAVLALAGLVVSAPPDMELNRPNSLLNSIDYFQKFSDGTIDPVLKQQLFDSPSNSRLEIIVQFYDEVRPEDTSYLEHLGIEAKRQFHVIPAVYGLATPAMVWALSEYERTYWIEYNEQLEYLMDTTTTTTNATKVWDTYITDITGKIEEPIDGTGVTVVVVDSGIDAGHPDLDYGEKVIYNYKSDVDGAYTTVENSDTSSGHGTHCSGTIGGNGDASAGSRRGMAPGCSIIGISTGEAVAILNALGALEWTYDHSQPNANPHTIRAVSNSWGTNAEYNPEDSIVKVTERLTYENNVVVVFAAGNAGSDNHDGSTVTTNPYSLTPSAISVAAHLKTPTGLAYFSSRGIASDNFTWPDFGAPGFQIWATEARKTLITANVKQANQEDAMDGYYMAISGTSMATPHVSGLTALLWQAAPSLRTSSIRDEYSGTGTYVNAEYWTSPITLIHETELIMKLTSQYMAPDDYEMNSQDDNGVPDNYSVGLNGKPYDYAQGYGFIDSEKAVALALTLEKLRYQNPEATVWDAMYSYNDIIKEETRVGETNILTTEWTGDWSYLNDGRESTVFTNHPKMVYIPNETTTMILDIQFDPVNLPERQAGTISLTMDYDGDGSADWSSGLNFMGNINGHKRDEIAISGDMDGYKNSLWNFNVEGQILSWPVEDTIAAGNPLLVGEKDFREGLIEYEVSVQLVIDVSQNETTEISFYDLRANVGWLELGVPSHEQEMGIIEMLGHVFDLSEARMPEEEPPEREKEENMNWWPVLIALLIILIILGYAYTRKKAGKPIIPGGQRPAPPQPEPPAQPEQPPAEQPHKEQPAEAAVPRERPEEVTPIKDPSGKGEAQET